MVESLKTHDKSGISNQRGDCTSNYSEKNKHRFSTWNTRWSNFYMNYTEYIEIIFQIWGQRNKPRTHTHTHLFVSVSLTSLQVSSLPVLLVPRAVPVTCKGMLKNKQYRIYGWQFFPSALEKHAIFSLHSCDWEIYCH